ncbi:hypothetical protein ABG775_27520 [Peribacillus simplex]|uniref:alpha/beta hydrolase n=1 Tax=Peribacillus simplex TaxID=1478 RepID=UPI0033946654
MTAAMVIPGAESFFLPGNSIGILICHGFNGTPQSVRYLGENSPPKVLLSSLLDWGATERMNMKWKRVIIRNGYRMLKWLMKIKRTCTMYFAIGQSMGGALVLDLATKVCL